MPSGPRRRTANAPIRMSTPARSETTEPWVTRTSGGPSRCCGDPGSRLGDQPTPELDVVEGALQDHPGLDAPERQTGGVHAAAPWARQHLAHRDAVLLKGLADPARLRAAGGVEVALGGAVVQARGGRVEAARGIAVTQHHDASRRTQGLPDRIVGLRDRGPADGQNQHERPAGEDATHPEAFGQRGAALRRPASWAGISRQSAPRGRIASAAESP